MSNLAKVAFPRPSSAETFLRGIGGTLRRCWLAYIDWRLQRLAIARLCRMSDRELRDIGLVRDQIEPAVRGSAQPTPHWRVL